MLTTGLATGANLDRCSSRRYRRPIGRYSLVVIASSGPNPINAVTSISTGSVRIHPEHAEASRLPVAVWLLLSRTWGLPRPVHCFIIEHREGLVLFDTGEDPASVSDPGYFPTSGLAGLIYRRLARFEITPDDGIGSQIRAAGYAPDDVRIVVLSHLHQDHIGGLSDLRNARIVVAEAEWRELESRRSELRGYLRRHIALPGLAWERITFSPTNETDLTPFTTRHDLFGDGSLVLIPTPGHTPGSLSMVVRAAGDPLLLVGDLAYDASLMARGVVPGLGDRAEIRVSTRRVLELASHLGGAAILPAHDPGTAGRLRAAAVDEGRIRDGQRQRALLRSGGPGGGLQADVRDHLVDEPLEPGHIIERQGEVLDTDVDEPLDLTDDVGWGRAGDPEHLAWVEVVAIAGLEGRRIVRKGDRERRPERHLAQVTFACERQDSSRDLGSRIRLACHGRRSARRLLHDGWRRIRAAGVSDGHGQS